MEMDEGRLHNPNIDAIIHVRREGKRWAIDLEDLSRAVKQLPELRDSPKVNQLVEAKAVITRASKGIRDQVISLSHIASRTNGTSACRSHVQSNRRRITHLDSLRPNTITNQKRHETKPMPYTYVFWRSGRDLR